MRARGKQFPPIELPMPVGGLSDEQAYDKQPAYTSSSMQNMRGEDSTGRKRLAKRPGRSRQNATAIPSMVRELVSATYTQPTVTHSAASPSVEWEQATPGNSDCRAGQTDASGNLYVMSGEGTIVKYSSAGDIIQTFALPTPAGARVGTLAVDEGPNVYCGVSGRRDAPAGVIGSGEPGNGMILGDVDDARLWKVRHAFRNNDDQLDPEMEVAWELSIDPEKPGPALRGLIGWIRVYGGKLYTLQHDNREWKSYMVVYDAIHSGIPIESFVYELECAYPASSLDVSPKGHIAISVEQFNRRGENPTQPGTIARLIGWTPEENIDDDLASSEAKHRFCAHLKVEAKYLRTTGGITPEDGDEVLDWLDSSGNGRSYRFAVDDGKKPPFYREKGLGGRPTIVSDGDTRLMISGVSPTDNADFRSGQRGMFPAYSDPDDAERSAQFALFAIMRPEELNDAALTDQYPLWDQTTTYSTLLDHQSMMVNRKASDTLNSSGNSEAGSVSWFLRSNGSDKGEGTSTGLMPAWMPNAFDNSAQALLISCFCDNGVDSGDITSMRSLYRIWGRPVDRFTSEADVLASSDAQYLMGSAHSDYDGMSLAKGEWSEIIVLDRRDLDTTGYDSVCSHPIEPDAADGNMVGQVVIANEGTGGSNLTAQPLAFSDGSPTVPAQGTWTSLNGKITTVKITQPGQGYSSRPTITATGYTGSSASLLAGMSYRAGTKSTTTIAEKIEGYLAWKYGCSHLLHTSSPSPGSVGTYTVNRVNSSGTAGTYQWDAPHPYYDPHSIIPFQTSYGPPESDITTGIRRFYHYGEILILMDSNGKLFDVISHNKNGIGLGCKFNADGTALYTVGSTAATDASGFSTAADVATVRKFTIGSDNTLTEAWSAESGLQMSGQTCAIDVDAAGNVYVPCNAPSDHPNAFTFAVLASDDGSTIHQYAADDSADGAGTSANQGAFAVALPRAVIGSNLQPTTPDYNGDLTHETVEYLYILGSKTTYAGTEIEKAVRKYRLVTSTPNGNDPRLRADLAIANGTVYRYDNGVPAAVSGGNVVLTAAGGAYDYVHAVTIGQKAYITDGTNAVVYDPKLGTVVPWEADHGELPARFRIVEKYRGRAVATGFGDGRVEMSRVLKPDDWERRPPVPTVAQACRFSETQVGDVPDIVTGFCEVSNHVALLGGNESVYVLRGDPMENGTLERIPGSVGMAFGRARCRGPNGTVWFFGTNPSGLYLWDGTIPRDMSDRKIQRRLRDIDLSTHYVRLAYDTLRRGVWIVALPYAYPTAIPLTYFYEIDNGAFHEDYIDDVDATVTAILAVDGDEPNDRRILTGHADGFVRYMDEDAVHDDGIAIAASALIGPIKSPIDGYEIRTKRLGATFASDQDGASWSLFTSDRPDVTGASERQGTFSAGANVIVPALGRGSYAWVQLEQASLTAGFAIERMWLEAEVGSVQRVRS